MAKPGRKPTPWAAYILTAVERGPVSYHRVVAEAAGLVPPGRGYREALAIRAGERRRWGLAEGSEEVLVGRDKNEAIRAGQRRIAMAAIKGLRQRGRILIYVDGDEKMVSAKIDVTDDA